MYRFDIGQQEDGKWKFEQDSISLIVEGYELHDGRHKILTPEKALAWFNINGHVYGVSNYHGQHHTVEEFYDAMRQQYAIFQAAPVAQKMHEAS
jgi:hypothetical protein